MKNGADAYLTREPEQIQAFRETWQLGKHSYLSYMRDRPHLCRELLSETGSVFVQIGEDNLHLVRTLLDEIFGLENFCSLIAFRTKIPLKTTMLPGLYDFIVWYAKDKRRAASQFRRLFLPRAVGEGTPFTWLELSDGTRRKMTPEEKANPRNIPVGSRGFRLTDLVSAGRTESCVFEFEMEGNKYRPGGNKSWKTNPEGMSRLLEQGRVMVSGNTPGYVFYANDYPVQELANVWSDTQGATKPVYVVQTSTKVIERCLLMTTDPGDLVLDPMCGSGTTCYVAEQWGRRWIGIDTSRVAEALARERILTSTFPYYELMDEQKGVDGGFMYRKVSHVTIGSVAQNRVAADEILYDQAKIDTSKIRVSGPFTVEALSRYALNPMQDNVPPEPQDPHTTEGQDHVATLIDALTKQGIPRKGGHAIKIDSLRRLDNIGLIQAEGGDTEADGTERRLGVSLGPRFGPITVTQIGETLHRDAHGYDLVVFAGFAATAEAQEYVSKEKLGRFNVALLEANTDLLVGDLLKTTSSSQTFRLFSAPEVVVKHGPHDGEVFIEIVGMDSFDASTGEVMSRGQSDLAAWFLDQDHDGVVFHVNQAFFPQSGSWQSLQRALKGTVDEELFDQLQSFESLPFRCGDNKRAAIRAIDDSGTASEVVVDLV